MAVQVGVHRRTIKTRNRALASDCPSKRLAGYKACFGCSARARRSCQCLAINLIISLLIARWRGAVVRNYGDGPDLKYIRICK